MSNVSTIFTVYKRHSLEEQLQRMSNQTISSDFYVWQNESHVDISNLKSKYEFSHIHSVNHNWKYHGRFTIPLMLETEYTVVLDDDTLPNPKWLEKCIRLCSEKNCIIGGNGRILQPSNLTHQIAVDQPEKDHEVDFVGHAWFFKTEWIKDFWKEPVVSHWTAEDIAFCATLKVMRGIPSYVPDFSVEEERGDSDKHKYGVDHNVIKDPSHINKHFNERLKVIKHWIDRGWEPLQNKAN